MVTSPRGGRRETEGSRCLCERSRHSLTRQSFTRLLLFCFVARSAPRKEGFEEEIITAGMEGFLGAAPGVLRPAGRRARRLLHARRVRVDTGDVRGGSGRRRRRFRRGGRGRSGRAARRNGRDARLGYLTGKIESLWHAENGQGQIAIERAAKQRIACEKCLIKGDDSSIPY